jgi:hypothetical protein
LPPALVEGDTLEILIQSVLNLAATTIWSAKMPLHASIEIVKTLAYTKNAEKMLTAKPVATGLAASVLRTTRETHTDSVGPMSA